MNRCVRTLLAAAAACAAGSAALGQVKISQVYGGGGSSGATYGRDYVELFNAGLSPVDLTGWTIQYAAATGTSWSSRPLSGTVQPGQYFLISLSPSLSPSGSLDLPTPDVQTTNLAISATAGKVALMRQTTVLPSGTACPVGDPNLIDFVGYGTANCFEGSGPTAAPSITTAVFRAANGCTDTNDNAADFAAVPPTPRNSASPTQSCAPYPPGADLGLVAERSQPCSLGLGGVATYTFTLTNYGPDAATDAMVVVTLPTGTTSFVSSTPPLAPAGDTLAYPVGLLGPGQSAVLTVDLMATAIGTANISATASTATPETFVFNNAAALADRVFDPVTSIPKTAVFNTRPEVASELDPVNAPGVRLTGVLNRIFYSADRSHWITVIDTDSATLTNDEALLVGTGTSWTVPVREGITVMPTGLPLFDFGVYQAIDDMGRFVFHGDDNVSSSTGVLDQFVAKDVGSGLVLVVREGDAVPGIPGGTFGVQMGSVTIQADGTTSFYSAVAGVPSTEASGLFSNDGATVVVQEGVDTPTGQIGGATEPYASFDAGTNDAFGFFVDPSGMNWQAIGAVTGPTATDRVLVYNNGVVVQEGATVPGTAEAADSPTPLNYNYLDPNGTQWAYGSFANDDDFVMRDGVILARTGDPIFTGSSLTWDDTNFAAGFFVATGNSLGDYVIGGLTSNPDLSSDAVLVLNGEMIIVQEGDPIDLDGNGLYDDDAFIRIIRNDFAALADDGTFYFGVELQTSANRCANGTTTTGQAMVRMQLPIGAPGGACCSGATCSVVAGSGGCTGANTSYAGDGTVCNVPGNSTTPCCKADYNQNGTVTVQDIFDFLSGYFSASAQADINGGGTSVQDIFDFLAAYFGGCA